MVLYPGDNFSTPNTNTLLSVARRMVGNRLRRRVRRATDAAAQYVGQAATRLLRGHQRPPPAFVTKRIDFTTRYVLANAGNNSVTVNDLLDSYFTAASATVGYRIFSAVKIRKLEVWGPAVGAFTTGQSDINFIWGAGQSGQDLGNPPQLINDVTLDQADVPHLCLVPPKNSVASMWQSSGSNTDQMFYIEAPAGSILDLHLSGIVYDGSGSGSGFTPAAVVSTIAGATAGYVYNRTLPSNTPTGWTPIVGIYV